MCQTWSSGGGYVVYTISIYNCLIPAVGRRTLCNLMLEVEFAETFSYFWMTPSGAVPARHPCATSDQHTCCLVCPFWSSALCLSQRRLSELVFWAASLSTGETGLQLVLPPLGDLETIDQSVGSPWRVHIETEECRWGEKAKNSEGSGCSVRKFGGRPGVPWTWVQFHGVGCSSMELGAVPWSWVQFHGVGCYSMEPA